MDLASSRKFHLTVLWVSLGDPWQAGLIVLPEACPRSQNIGDQGAWVAQSVGHPTLAQVMMSGSVGSSPVSGSVLIAQSLEPAWDSMSLSLSAPSPLTISLSFSLSLSK